MLRYLAPPLLLLFSGTAFAACEDAGRIQSNSTTISISSSSENPRPGQEITLTALLESPSGYFSVSCLTPDKDYNPWVSTNTNTGGTISVFAGSNLIGSMQITPENTRQVDTQTHIDAGGLRFYYYGFNTTSYALKYVMPSAAGTQNFTARFSGDRHFASGSQSPPLQISSVADMTPVTMYLIN